MSEQLQLENENQTANTPLQEQDPPAQAVPNKRSADELTVGGDSIADLIRKAKASKTASWTGPSEVVEHTEGRQDTASDIPMEESVESVLSCPICSDYLYKPVAAISCLHNFCGSCLIPWLKRSCRCPSCRAKVTSVKDDHRINNLLASYLQLHPENARTEEDKKELDKIYKPGDLVEIRQTADDDSDVSGDEEEENDEDDEEGRVQPCRCCNPPEPNVYGFACEHPIPPSPASMVGTEYLEGVSYHTTCSRCRQTMPDREGMSCENCASSWCGSLFPCVDPAHLKKFADHSPGNVISNDWPSVYFAFDRHPVERIIYSRWVQDNELTYEDIVSRFKEWYIEEAAKPDFGPAMDATAETILCVECFVGCMELKFFDWWIYEKEKTGAVDNREKCWYGKNCRTQIHNPDHAARLNHACHEIPLDQRRRGFPAVPGRIPVVPQPPLRLPSGDAGPARRPQPSPPLPPPPRHSPPAPPPPAVPNSPHNWKPN